MQYIILEDIPKLYKVIKYNKDDSKKCGYDLLLCNCGASSLRCNYSKHKKNPKKHKTYVDYNNDFIVIDKDDNQITLLPL